MASLSAEVVGTSYTPGGGQRGSRSTGNFGSPRTALTHSQEVHLDGLRGSADCVVKTFAVRRSAEGVVGLRFYRDGADLSAPVVVSEVVPASPAALSGVQPGQTIEQIDAHSLEGLPIPAVAKMLQGAPGSNIRLTTGAPARLATPRQAPSGRLASGASTVYSEFYGADQKSPRASAAAAARPASSPGRDLGVDPLGAYTSRHYQTVQITRDQSGSVGLTFCQSDGAGPFEIVDVAPGGAAARTMKIAPGDLIYRVGRWDVTELLPENVTELLRGAPGSIVELELGKNAGKNQARSSHGAREGSILVDVVDIKISLDINSATAGMAGSRQRTAFEEVLLQDLATASQHPEHRFKVQAIDTDSGERSTVVTTRLYRDDSSGAVPPDEVAARLVQQASQPKSGLLLGDISGHCTCIEIVHAGAGNDVPEVAVGCGNLMGALRSAATTSPPSSSGVPQRKETHVLESIGAQAFLSIDDAYHSVEKMFDSSQLKDPSSDAIEALETNNAGFLLVLDLDFSTVGEEGSSERTDFQRRLQSDLAIASGWRGGEDSLEFADVTVVRQAAGIGLHFSVAKHPKGVPAPARVKSLAAGSVAESAGLKEGQMIYKIDGQDITMYPPDKTAALLRGAPGTQVVLTVTSPLPVAAASTDMTSQSRPRRPRGGLPPESFHVKTLSPGSVRADIQASVNNDSNHDAGRLDLNQLVADLAAQMHDPASKLRKGSLTRHVRSLTPSSSHTHTVTLQRGKQGTVGLRFFRREGVTEGPFHVFEFAPGSPAQQCGRISVGDRMLEIDGRSVLRLGMNETSALLKGAPFSNVAVTMQGDEEGLALVQTKRGRLATSEHMPPAIDFAWALFAKKQRVTGYAVVLCVPENADAELRNAGHLKGKMAVAKRGGATFMEMAQRAERAGAQGLVVINDEDALFVAGSTPGFSSNIPIVVIKSSDGAILLRAGDSSLLKEKLEPSQHNNKAESSHGQPLVAQETKAHSQGGTSGSSYIWKSLSGDSALPSRHVQLPDPLAAQSHSLQDTSASTANAGTLPVIGAGMAEAEVQRALSFANHLAQEHEKVVDSVNFYGSFARAEPDMQLAKCGCFGTNFLVLRPKL